MPEISGNLQNPNQTPSVPAHGSQAERSARSSVPMALRRQEPDWSGNFWAALTVGLPSSNLLLNPYFPDVQPTRGGWRGVIEHAVKPTGGRVDGVTGRTGDWSLTPEEATNLHAVETAKRLLTEAPECFSLSSGNTYFCFLEVAYAPFPEWAIIHRVGGEVFIREDYRLCRPNGETIMMAMVVGPVFELDPGEIRLWEAVAMELNRAFVVVEDEQDLA